MLYGRVQPSQPSQRSSGRRAVKRPRYAESTSSAGGSDFDGDNDGDDSNGGADDDGNNDAHDDSPAPVDPSDSALEADNNVGQAPAKLPRSKGRQKQDRRQPKPRYWCP